MKYLVDGLGETLGGDVLAGVKPIYGNTKIWYVDSASGSDAGTADSNQQHPFATLAYAGGKCTAGDIIVLAPTHNENIAAAAGCTNNVTIVGVGTTSGKPSPKLTISNASGYISTGIGVSFRNVYFGASSATTGQVGAIMPGADNLFAGCCFEPGASDTKPMVHLDTAAGYLTRFQNCTFTSVDTQASPTAVGPISWTAAGSGMTLELDGCTFDNGTKGFNGYTLDGHLAAPYLHAWNISLLRGADMYFHAGTTGWIHVATTTGGGSVRL